VTPSYLKVSKVILGDQNIGYSINRHLVAINISRVYPEVHVCRKMSFLTHIYLTRQGTGTTKDKLRSDLRYGWTTTSTCIATRPLTKVQYGPWPRCYLDSWPRCNLDTWLRCNLDPWPRCNLGTWPRCNLDPWGHDPGASWTLDPGAICSFKWVQYTELENNQKGSQEIGAFIGW